MVWGINEFSILLSILTFSGTSVTAGVGDIQVGDCLTMDQIQELVGVSDPHVYQAEPDSKCGVTYPLAGETAQAFECGLNFASGSWNRVIKEHKEPGVFFPSPVPCMASVSELQKEVWNRNFISEESACLEEETFISSFQSESLVTKLYDVGQGEIYLPNPMIVHREDFSRADDGQVSLSRCQNTELVGKYGGWGTLEMTFKASLCGESKPFSCRWFKVEAGKNSDDQSCALVKKIKECL